MAVSERYDVIVAGGGSAGVAAAVGAANAGARTLLVENYGFLGGAATHSLVLAWCGFYPQRPPPQPRRVVRGVADRVLHHLVDLGLSIDPYHSPTGNWNIRLNPEATKIALDRTLAEARVDVRLHSRVIGADVAGSTIEAIRIADHRGLHTITAGAFIDCSGEADLAFLAGAKPSPHPRGHAQPASYPVRITGIAPGHNLDRAPRAAALSKIESQLGRAGLRTDGGIMTILPGTDDVWWLAVDVHADGLDGADLAEAERDGRDLIWRGVEALRRHIPGFERANVAATGPHIGIRETRHAATRDSVVEADISAGRIRPDGVALGCWPMEIHHGPGTRPEYRPVGGDGTYSIPLGALHSADFTNLWLGGRTIGADYAAYASVRVMATAFATGHAAGVAAAIAVARRDASADAVRAELIRQGAF